MTESRKAEAPALTEPNFEALYYEAAGRAVEYAQEMGELREELEAERRAHAEKAELLEHYRTLADYKQERLERRNGERRTGWPQGEERRNPFNLRERRKQLIASWRES